MPQQVTTGPALMEDIKRTNVAVVRGSGTVVGQSVEFPPRRDPYAMEIVWRRNCYACRGFRHMTCYCRNRRQRERVAENWRVEYGGGRIEEIPNFS